jgi:hypothetical protein
MADAFGALTFPATAPIGDDQAFADPALDVFADFFFAVLTSTAGAAWLGLFPGEPVVKKIRKCDPEEADFIETDLPALYIWRERGTAERAGDTFAETRDVMRLLWVPDPPRDEKRTAQKSQFFNLFEKTLAHVAKRELHSSYRHPNDTSESGAAYGSVVRKFAGVSQWGLVRVDRTGLDIPIQGGKPLRYPALQAEFFLVELQTTDPVAFGFVDTSALDLQLLAPAQPPDLPSPLVLQHAREPKT